MLSSELAPERGLCRVLFGEPYPTGAEQPDSRHFDRQLKAQAGLLARPTQEHTEQLPRAFRGAVASRVQSLEVRVRPEATVRVQIGAPEVAEDQSDRPNRERIHLLPLWVLMIVIPGSWA